MSQHSSSSRRGPVPAGSAADGRSRSRPWPASVLRRRAPSWWLADPAAYERFVVELEAALDDVLGPAVIDQVGGWATVSPAGADVRLALGPLAEACAALAPRRWPAVLRRELSVVSAGRVAVANVDVDDLERLRPALRVRVVATLDRAGDLPAPFAHELTAGLWAVLVVDLPTVSWVMPRRAVRRWAVDEAALVRDTAMASVRAAWPRRPAVDPSATTVLRSRSPYAAAVLAAPGGLVPEVAGPWVLAAPTRHTVVVQPATADDDDVDRLGARVIALHSAGPGPVSPHLYRWAGGDAGLEAGA